MTDLEELNNIIEDSFVGIHYDSYSEIFELFAVDENLQTDYGPYLIPARKFVLEEEDRIPSSSTDWCAPVFTNMWVSIPDTALGTSESVYQISIHIFIDGEHEARSAKDTDTEFTVVCIIQPAHGQTYYIAGVYGKNHTTLGKLSDKSQVRKMLQNRPSLRPTKTTKWMYDLITQICAKSVDDNWASSTY